MSEREIRLKCLELAILVSKEPVVTKDGLKITLDWETKAFFMLADKFFEYISSESK